jgi:hypothetical protein
MTIIQKKIIRKERKKIKMIIIIYKMKTIKKIRKKRKVNIIKY